jgi:RNA polymerase sigma-70 factor (ECF subfamily)
MSLVSSQMRDETPQPDPDDEAAVLSRLLDRREQFLAFLEGRVGTRDAAEDVLQAAYLKALESSMSIHREDSAVAWFYRLLRNALVDRRRRGAAEVRAVEQHGHETALVAEEETDALRGAVCRCVDALIPTLKPEYAAVVRQVDLEGGSVQEVATAVGVTANNLSVRLYRARAALRKLLERTCGACAEHACLDCGCKAPQDQGVTEV